MFLPYDIFVQAGHDLARRWQTLKLEFGFVVVVGRSFLEEDTLAQLHTIVADENAIWTGDETIHLVVAAAAE
jgi:hypothetical protein